MLSACISSVHVEGTQDEPLENRKTDVHAEHVYMVKVSISPDPYAQCTLKGRSMRVRNSIFLIICKVPKTAKF